MGQMLSSSSSLFVRTIQLLSSRRLLSVMCLGFASGLPLLLTGSTLQAWYTVSNISIVTIGALSLVGQPYVYKFLWAPFLDRYVIPLGGRRRGWIFLFQVLLLLSIALMGFLQPNVHPVSLALLALFVAFLSASQDIAIDAYRTDLLKPSEWGLGIALNTFGYRVAILVAGAMALILADHVGWQMTYLMMAVLMLLSIFVTMQAPNPDEMVENIPTNLKMALIYPFKEFLSRRLSLTILIFIVVYKLGDVFTLVLGTAFLIRGIGFSLSDVGLIYKIGGLLGTFLGVFVGGILLPRLGLFRSLLYFGLIQAISNLPFMLLALLGKNYLLLIFTIVTESFGSGLGSVAFVSFIMSLCDHRYTATQFALFSAFAAVGRVFVGPIAGLMVDHLGWVQYYFWAFLIGLPGLVMLFWLREIIYPFDIEENVVQEPSGPSPVPARIEEIKDRD